MRKSWCLAGGSDDAKLGHKNLSRAGLERDPLVAQVADVEGSAAHPKSTTYPRVGVAAAERLADGTVDRAVLGCATGIVMAIVANKAAGVRATTAHDICGADRSVLSHECQVLALGQRVIRGGLAWRLGECLGNTFGPFITVRAKGPTDSRPRPAALRRDYGASDKTTPPIAARCGAVRSLP